MVIHDLYVVGVSVPPYETDPPLVVNADAVLALTVSPQAFQSIPWWSGQVAEFRREMYLVKLPARDALNRPEPPSRLSMKEFFGVKVTEGPDHSPKI